jgi:hypothetical protein
MFLKKVSKVLRAAMLALVMVGGVSAAHATGDDDPQAAIVAAGATVTGYAKAAGAAGIACLVVVWGISVAKKAGKTATS